MAGFKQHRQHLAPHVGGLQLARWPDLAALGFGFVGGVDGFKLFAELVVSVFLLVLFLIYIYNTHISYDFMLGLLLSGLGVYVVFNIVRSYQLMGNVRIPYKLHFFLYICAFKILPVLLLVKYILNNVVQ